MLKISEQVCSYCNKSLVHTTSDGGVHYRVGIFLKNKDTTIQICESCVAGAFISVFMNNGVSTDCMIDFFDRVNIGHKE